MNAGSDPKRIDRRQMLGRLAAAAAIGALAPRRLLGLTTSGPATAARPFRMAAIGDSVMWGQGLRPEQKFATLVQRWLEPAIARPVELQLLARSGATIVGAADAADRASPQADAKSVGFWEVPADYPSTIEQARRLRDPATLDLVLVTAGANDFGFTRILSPALTPAQIEADAAKHFGARMFTLLDRMLSGQSGMPQFPRARIVVTGYYKAVSPQSVGVAVSKAVGTAAAYTADLRAAIADFYGIQGTVVNELLNAGFCINGVFRSTIMDNAAALLRSSNKHLAKAVADANAKYPAAAGGGPRVEFVPVHFADENALGAPKSFLWNEGDADPMAPQRRAECELQFGKSLDPVEGLKCHFAQMLHPNPAGARAYADAITARLQPHTSRWRLEGTMETAQRP